MNLRQAYRALLKSPVVTGAAILSLALGIGANAAMFSIFEELVLRPLPVEQPEDLVNLLAPGPKPGSQSSNVSGGTDAVFSYPMFRDLQASREAREVFSGIAAHRYVDTNLAFEGNTVAGEGVLVSGSYFPVLDLRPARGRLLGPEDDRDVGAHRVAVLSHGFWETDLGGPPGVIGKTLVVNGEPLTIVGVAPRGFSGTSLGQRPDVFLPITLTEALVPNWEVFENRRSYWIYLFARLAPGTSLEQAQAAINAPYRSIVQEIEVPLQSGMSEQTLERFAAKQVVLEPGARGQSEIHGEISTPLLLLLCVTGFVLLIACVNLTNLLLVRATHRSGEIAVRLALGAKRRHVVTQLLTESFVLAICGALLGWLVARGTLGLLISLLPPEADLGFGTDLGPVAWGFLALLAAVTGLVGLIPALRATRHDLTTTLQGQAGRGGTSRGSQRLRTTLVTLEVALAMMLLVSAGLFARSLYNVSRVDLGIEVEQVATFAISPELNGYAPEASRALFLRLEEELAALPGVQGVTVSSVALLSGNNWGSDLTVQGFEAGPDTDTNARYSYVGPGYFRTLGIPLLAGREFEPRDALGAPRVAVVNEAFARKFNLGYDAVGKRMQQGRGNAIDLEIEIVGLAASSKYSEVKDDNPPLFFLPYRQAEDLGSVAFYVRTAGDPKQILPSLRSVVAGLDPNLPVEDLHTLAYQVGENVFLDRMLMTLSSGFALLAMLLAAIGLYGVVAYSVAQRTREIGVRMALGAGSQRIRRWILGHVGRMILVGSALGLLCALALGRLAGSLLFELDGHDPLTLGISAVVLALVALAAGAAPAWKASRIDPMSALRSDG